MLDALMVRAASYYSEAAVCLWNRELTLQVSVTVDDEAHRYCICIMYVLIN